MKTVNFLLSLIVYCLKIIRLISVTQLETFTTAAWEVPTCNLRTNVIKNINTFHISVLSI